MTPAVTAARGNLCYEALNVRQPSSLGVLSRRAPAQGWPIHEARIEIAGHDFDQGLRPLLEHFRKQLPVAGTKEQLRQFA